MSTKEGAKREGAFAALLRSRSYRIAIKYLYAWGASVVIIGSLFLILHLPGANEMLIVGLGTLAVIFFFAAFEPLPEEKKQWDWSKVFPQLAEEEEEAPVELGLGVGGAGGLTSGLGPGIKSLQGGGLTPELLQQLASSVGQLQSSLVSLAQSIEAYQTQLNTLAHTVNQLNAVYKSHQQK